MDAHITKRQKATLVGILILLAYSMLAYSITGHIMVGMITDVISGLAVIGIAVIMFPIFAVSGNRYLNFAYLGSRMLEGSIMVVGGFFLLSPGLQDYRNMIYEDIHIYFFIAGALFFYLLLYQSKVIPRFLSIWGIGATIALTVMTVAQLMGLESPLMVVLILPIILNEIYLAFWLMIKGFSFLQL